MEAYRQADKQTDRQGFFVLAEGVIDDAVQET
jgi:hypothetical protein